MDKIKKYFGKKVFLAIIVCIVVGSISLLGWVISLSYSTLNQNPEVHGGSMIATICFGIFLSIFAICLALIITTYVIADKRFINDYKIKTSKKEHEDKKNVHTYTSYTDVTNNKKLKKDIYLSLSRSAIFDKIEALRFGINDNRFTLIYLTKIINCVKKPETADFSALRNIIGPYNNEALYKICSGVLSTAEKQKEILEKKAKEYEKEKKKAFQRLQNEQLVKISEEKSRSSDIANKLGISSDSITLYEPNDFIRKISGETITGVYVIYNESQNKYYVGQAQNIKKRVLNHFNGRGGNADIYADYKYGNRFYVTCFSLNGSPFKSLDKFERYLIIKLKSYAPFGYNETKGNGAI